MSVLKKVRRSLIKRGVQEDPCNNQLSHNGTTWKSISPEITKHLFYQFWFDFSFPFLDTKHTCVALYEKYLLFSGESLFPPGGSKIQTKCWSCRRQPILNQASSFQNIFHSNSISDMFFSSGKVKMFVLSPLSTKNICVILDH